MVSEYRWLLAQVSLYCKVYSVVDGQWRRPDNFTALLRYNPDFLVQYCDILSTCLVQVETEVFDQMDELVFSGQGDEEYAEMFKEM